MGHGSVGIIVFGESFNIASADLRLSTSPFELFIRAEGPLGVYIEITITDDGIEFDGGLGFLDDLIEAVSEAIGVVVTAVSDAVVYAANVVANAFEDLGEAILDLGAAIGDAILGFANDVEDFINDIAGAIAEFFSSSRTVVNTFYPTAKYSYSTALSISLDSTLTIDMSGGRLTGVESPLTLAIVDGKLIVDGPNKTENVKIAERQKQERDWDWWGATWGSWYNVGSAFGAVFEDIEYSNMKAFTGVTKIIIHGTAGADTIVLDTASITSIAAEVYGKGGADTIVTAGGNDYVEGGDGNDIIFTYGGNDTVHGGNGDDTLVGGVGNDSLYGGAGQRSAEREHGQGSGRPAHGDQPPGWRRGRRQDTWLPGHRHHQGRGRQ